MVVIIDCGVIGDDIIVFIVIIAGRIATAITGHDVVVVWSGDVAIIVTVTALGYTSSGSVGSATGTKQQQRHVR